MLTTPLTSTDFSMRLRHKREVAFWPDLSEGEEDSVDGGEGGDVLKRS